MLDSLADLDLDLDCFSNSGTVASKFSPRYCKPKLSKRPTVYQVKYNNALKMAKDLSGDIMAGATVHAMLSGNFIFGDFLEAFIVENNLLVDDMMISTLSVGQENIDSLHNLIVGDYVQKLDMIVSDYFFSHNRQNIEYIYKKLDIDNKFQLATAGVHTKITLLKVGDKKIVLHGSANMRSSRSVEVVTIESSPELYDFHKTWHDDTVAKYLTIRKSIRAGELWEIIDG